MDAAGNEATEGISGAVLPPPSRTTSLEGLPDGEHPEAHTILFDESGFYISDEFRHRLLFCHTDGSLRGIVGGEGMAGGNFRYPRGLLLVGGRLWVCDALNHRIQILSIEGEYLGDIADGPDAPDRFLEPTDLTAGRGGAVLLADRRNHRIVFLDRDGREISYCGRQTPKQKKYLSPMLHALTEPCPLFSQESLGGPRWFYLNQIAARGEFLWSVDNEALRVHGPLGQVVFETALGRCFSTRGLSPYGQAAVMLDEISGGLLLVTLGGVKVLFTCGEGRLHGCGIQGDSIVALRNSRLLHWPLSSLICAAGDSKSASDRQEIKYWAVCGNLAEGNRDGAVASAVSLFDSAAFDERYASLAMRLSGPARDTGDLGAAVARTAEGWMRQSLETFERCFERLNQIEEFYSTSLAVTPPYRILLPLTNTLLNENLLGPAAKSLVADIYQAMRRLSLAVGLVLLWSGVETGTKPSIYPSDLDSLCSRMAKLAEKAAGERSPLLLRCHDAARELSASGTDKELMASAQTTAGFIIYSQLATCCSDALELFLGVSGDLDLNSGTLGELNRAMDGLPRNVRNFYLFKGAVTTDLDYPFGWGEELEPHSEPIAQFAKSVIELHNARLIYLKAIPRTTEGLIPFIRFAWEHLVLVEEYARSHGLLLPDATVEFTDKAALVLDKLGYEDEAAALLRRDTLTAPKEAPRADKPDALFSRLGALAERLLVGKSTSLEGKATIEELAGDDPVKLQRVLMGLWPWLEEKDFFALMKLLTADGILTQSRKRALRSLSAALIRASDGKADALEGNTAVPAAAVGSLLSSMRHSDKALPLLREAADYTMEPSLAAGPLLDSLYSEGFGAEAGRLEFKLDTFFQSPYARLGRRPGDTSAADYHRRQFKRFWRVIIREREVFRLRYVLHMFRHGGFPVAAEKLMEEFCRRRPDRPDLLLTRAEFLDSLGRRAEALELIARHDERFGRTGKSLIAKAGVLMRMGRFAAVEDILSADGLPAEAAALLAESAAWQGDFGRAVNLSARCGADDARNPEVAAALGRIRLYAFDPPAAVEACRPPSFDFPLDPRTGSVLIAALLKSRRLRRARRCLDRYFFLGCRDAAFEGFLGVLTALGGQAERARRLMRESLIKAPWGYFGNTICTHLAHSYRQFPPETSDVKFASEMARLYPALPTARWLRAAMLAADSLREALALLDGAPSAAACDAPFQDLLRAELALAAGEVDSALETLEPMLGRYGIEDINLACAEAYLLRGDAGKARAAVEPLRRAFAANPRLRRILERIA